MIKRGKARVKVESDLRERLIRDYKSEIDYFTRQKDIGLKTVSSFVAGKELADGRLIVPIDELIRDFEKCIKALKAGANPEEYNY